MGEMTMKTAICRETPQCTHSVDFVGDPKALRMIGWHIEVDEQGEFKAWCPMHHPKGIQFAEIRGRYVRIAVIAVLESFSELVKLKEDLANE